MARFLFTTLPTNDLGLLTRSLPIADRLAARGHQVVFSSPGRAPRKVIGEAGFENLVPRHPLYALGEQNLSPWGFVRVLRSERVKQDYGSPFAFLAKLVRSLPTRFAPPTSEMWDMGHAGAMVGMLSRRFVQANCDAMKALISEEAPDVVVDFWNPFASIAARALRKPLVTVIQADAHPANRGFMWWRERPPDVPTPVPAVNKVLARYGLGPIERLDDLNLGDLTLIVGIPETDPLPEEAEVTYIGPVLWQKRGARLPEWMQELDGDRPVIWVYPGNPRYAPFGTPADSVVVLQACVQALADEDAQVVLTTGHHDLPEQGLSLPANFRHAAYVPGLAMAEKSDLMIHHGGYGSCQTGLYTGTPAVIIPTFSERESNARRVAAVGAGALVLPTEDAAGKKHVRAERVRAEVRRVLSDPAFAASARAVSERMREYGGASLAARLIEDAITG